VFLINYQYYLARYWHRVRSLSKIVSDKEMIVVSPFNCFHCY